MNFMTWEYIAGFFDGEGCIGIYPDKSTTRVLVEMSQAEPQERVLYEIQEFLAEHGIMFSARRVERRGTHAPCHKIYTVNRRVASEFLKHIEPFLRVKRLKAKELIAWADSNPARRGAHKRPLKKSTVNEIIRLSKEGVPQVKIAEQLGISNQSMVSRIVRRNLTIPA